MYNHFGLVLVVNHACNLRCTYCYTGDKRHRPMPLDTGKKAIDRAIASIDGGGVLELGFFGGEPLVEAALIESLTAHARQAIAIAGRHIGLSLSLTTNGTVNTPAAWRVLADPELHVAISCDGLPGVHDRHRRGADGSPTFQTVLATIRRLLDSGRTVRVVMVVRPDTAASLANGIEFLWNAGVREFEPSLDLWSAWTPGDVRVLCDAVRKSAKVWRSHLPLISIGWFDEKAADLSQTPLPPSARCGFGAGEIAVSPAGNLYPCERLVHADRPDNPMRLPGHVMDGETFLHLRGAPGRDDPGCAQCALQQSCGTTCRCSNYLRTGDVRRPDGLLCEWNQACIDAVADIFDSSPEVHAPAKGPIHLALAT